MQSLSPYPKNEIMVHNGAPMKWSRGEGGFHGKAGFKKRTPLCKWRMGREEIKDYEKHEEYKS